MPSPSHRSYDAVIVGGGHNGLAAAAYLARAGLRTLVLERLPEVGGAAVSTEAFPGTRAQLSRYSYLVSLLPHSVVQELDLDLELRSRRTASYTPTIRNGRHTGLFVEREEGEATRASFGELTGSDEEYDAWRAFHADVQELVDVLAPTLTRPLPRERDLRASVRPEVWDAIVGRPLGEIIEERFTDDLVRGVVATDGLIGTHAGLHDRSLAQNRCFLYHVMGNGTGEWRVPVGGMGAASRALAKAAAGAEIHTGAEVSRIDPGGDGAEVTWHDGDRTRTARAGVVLANVAPWVLDRLTGTETDSRPSGSQLKINLLLRRLPRLRSGADPTTAFAGTFHIGEGYADLARTHAETTAGKLPSRPAGEFYCHSLTDASILGPLAGTGAHTLTFFGLLTPETVFAGDVEAAKAELVRRILASVDVHLEEPLLDCVLTDSDGRPCIEALAPQDVERELGMPGGHIFHGDLAWPWASDREPLDSPALRWGVATDHPSVLLCGSGARRGGAVSALGGHNAARAVLETR